MRSWLSQLAVMGAQRAVLRGAFVSSVYSRRVISNPTLLRPASALCPRRGLVFSCTGSASSFPSTRPDPFNVPSRKIADTAQDSSKTRYELPEVEDDDLEERFIRGSGPGGQKINKTASCVVRFCSSVTYCVVSWPCFLHIFIDILTFSFAFMVSCARMAGIETYPIWNNSALPRDKEPDKESPVSEKNITTKARRDCQGGGVPCS